MTTTMDRTWSEATTFSVVWPLDMPDRATVVAACREVAGASPHHVIACDSADVDALMAVAFARTDAMEVDAVAFVVFHSPHGLVVAHSHDRGDAAYTLDLRDRLMSAMGVGAAPAGRPDRPMSLHRCAAALLARWAGDPRRPARAYRFLQVRRDAARRPAPPDRPTAVDVVEPRTTFVVVPATEIAELRATLADLGTEASVSMGLLYAIWSAHATGEHAIGQLQVMVGLRRYSRLLEQVRGNMVGRLVLPVPAGSTAGLAAFGETVRSWIDSAEPLFLHAAKVAAVKIRSAAAAVRGRPGGHWESSWREGGVDVVWSDCGTAAGMVEAAVRWSPDHPAAQRSSFFVVRPVGPGLAINVHWVGRSANLALTYDASKLDIGPVLAVLADSPARYLRSMAAAGPRVR